MHRYAYTVVRDFAAPTDRLLEVGFGEGYGSTLVRDAVAEYHGVEIDATAVEHAAAKYSYPNVAFHHYVDALDFPDDWFDVVISFQVIEHVVDVDGFLAEIHRVARPGAVVLVVTPNRRHRLEDGERPWNRYHVREYSGVELEGALRAEFDSVDVLAIRGSQFIEETERARVARARRLARLDPLGLRYALPEGLDNRIRARLRKSAAPPESAHAHISPADLWRTPDSVDDALDLLGVARA